MPFRYFDYAGRPARIMFDAGDCPGFCEVWDSTHKKLVRDEGHTLDVLNSYESRLISGDAFTTLLNNVSGYVVECCDFKGLLADRRASCMKVLTSGNAVNPDSAAAELPKALVTVIAISGDEIVGIGAIKRARPEYAKKRSKYADFAFNPHWNELGYVAVAKNHQNRGLSSRITETLLSHHEVPLWATTDDDSMKAVLRKYGFHHEGQEWKGNRASLSLWIRD